MYYPKSKIQENQYTPGGLFIDPTTGNSYVGFYHTTYDGRAYTGVSHSISSMLLSGTIPSASSSDILSRPSFIANFDYDRVSHGKMSYLFNLVLPTPIYPVPTSTDYKAGQFNRYFMQLITNLRITEISAEGYQNIQTNPLYFSLTLIWKLTGNTANVNAKTLAMNESKMKGISSYLSNLMELSRNI